VTAVDSAKPSRSAESGWHHRQLEVDVTERDERTARADLFVNGRLLTGRGEARRKATDFDVPEIGEELAIGRALIDLGSRLVRSTAADIEAIEGKPVTLRV
jgi:hypothetical protein